MVDELERSRRNILDILEIQDNYCLIKDEDELPTELQFLYFQIVTHKDCGIDAKKLNSLIYQYQDVKARYGKAELEIVDKTMTRVREELIQLLTK